MHLSTENFKAIVTLCCTLFICSFAAKGSQLRGTVKDKTTKAPLIGAVISINSLDKHAITGLDGTYKLEVPIGDYKVETRYVGYKTMEQSIHVMQNTGIVMLDFPLTEDEELLDQVVVRGTADQSTIANARSSERKSDNVLNVISAKSISLSPDLDVANVVQRVSGVTIERSSNSAGNSHAIIRGMDKRYNYVLINGIKIPSPNDKNRYVPLDIFPSDLVDKVEVYKSLTPSMEGDAVGGVINMVMKNAPQNRTIQANISAGYHDLFWDKSFKTFDYHIVQKQSPFERFGPNYQATTEDFTKKNLDMKSKSFVPDLYGTFSLGDRFMHKKLGVLVAASFNRENRGANSFRYTPDLLEGTSLPKLTNLSTRSYYSTVTRWGVHSKLDYAFNRKHHLKLYGAFLNLDENEIRDLMDVSVLGSSNIKNSDRKTYETRFRNTRQNIFNLTLQGEHDFSAHHHLEWSLVNSMASKHRPDEAYFVRVLNNSFVKGYATHLIAEDGENKRFWRFNKDQDYAAYLNYRYDWRMPGMENEIKVGGLYRMKTRSSFFNSYFFNPNPGVQAYGYNWKPDDPNLNYSTWEKYEDVTFTVGNPGGSTTNEFNHDFQENIGSAYIEVKTVLNHSFQILGGARVEQTHRDYTLLAPRPNQSPTGARDYTDILPSIHLKYSMGSQANIRASYFKSIVRPGYYEILPYTDKNEDYVEIGNPNIKRTIAHNFDLRFEKYFQHTNQFLIGAFYKHLINPIEYARYPGETTYSKITEWVQMPDNFGVATNYGMEVDFIKYFQKIGFKANYTFTESQIQQTKQIKHRVDPTDPSSEIITTNTTQTRPLEGQSKHIGNASLLYKDPSIGFNGQLACVYTGEHIVNVSNFLDNDEWAAPLALLDLSMEKQWEHVTLFLKVKNLLNTPYKVIIKQPLRSDSADFPYQGNVGDHYVVRRDIYNQSFKVGIRLRFNQ